MEAFSTPALLGAPPAARAPAAETGSPFGLKAVRAAFYAFVLSIPFETLLYVQDQNQRDSTVSVSRIVGIVLLGLALVSRRACFKRFPKVFWLTAWYVGVFTFSQLWIPSGLDARFAELRLTLVQMLVLLVISFNLLSDGGFRERLLRAYGWGVALVAAGMLLGLLGVQLDPGVETRATLAQQNPNVVAGLFAFAALCVAGDPLVLGPRRKAWRVLAALGACAVLGLAILRTGSRGGLLAFCAGILALGACGGKATRKARAAAVAALLCLVGGLVYREFQRGSSAAERLEKTWDQGDTAGRTGIYDAAWSMFLDRPFLGYGGANNRRVLATYLDYADDEAMNADRDTHNVYLAVLTETGLVGGLPFLAALLLALWGAWRAGRERGDALPFALMCALLVMNASETGSREKIFWIVLAAAAASG